MEHELDRLGRPYKFRLFSGALVIVDFLSDAPGRRFTMRIEDGPYHGSVVTRMQVKDWYSTALPEELQGKTMLYMQREGLLYMDPMPGVQTHVEEAEVIGRMPDGRKLHFTELSFTQASEYLKAVGAASALSTPRRA